MKVTIDINKLVEEMEDFGYIPTEDVNEGWTNSMVDSLQKMTDIETKVRKVFEKKYPNVKFT